MQAEPYPNGIPHDEWLESQCRRIEEAGRNLALAVSEVNARTREALQGGLGRKQRITPNQIRQAETAWETLHEAQVAVQDALFDCEHEMRALRERDITPAELLVDGDRLIIQYRFLRRRARVLDGLLAYLPGVSSSAHACLECLHLLRDGAEIETILAIPDCGFALVALEQLSEEEYPPGTPEARAARREAS